MEVSHHREPPAVTLEPSRWALSMLTRDGKATREKRLELSVQKVDLYIERESFYRA